MMIFKRIISAFTCSAVLASALTTFSGCSMKEFFDKNGGSTASENGALTNGDWLKMVNDAFGMQVDENAENGDLDTAKKWGVVGDDENVDLNAPVDDKFIASTLTKAAGFADRNASDEEIIRAAVEHHIIQSPDAKVSDPAAAADALVAAQQGWSHRVPEEHLNIDLADNVQNFTGNMNVTDIKFDGDNINIPSAYAASLTENSVYIIPKDENGKGGAYKVVSTTVNDDGTTSVKSVPAKLEDVYKKIDVSGVFSPDLSGFKSTNPNVQVVANTPSNEGTIKPLANANEEGGIKPLAYAGEEGCIQPMASVSADGLSLNIGIGDFTVTAGISDITLTADIDWDFGILSGLDINRITMYADYTTEIGVSYEWGNMEDAFKKKFCSDPEIEIGEIPIEICPGIAVKLRLVLSLEASGEISLSIKTTNHQGFEISGSGYRPINESSTTEELGISGEAGAYITGVAALTLDYLVDEVDLLNLELKVGPTLKGEMKESRNTDTGEPLLCIDVSGYLKAELKLYLLKEVMDYFDMEASITLAEWDESSSPIKWNAIHIENFQFVDHCTADDSDTTTTTTEPATVPVGVFEIDKTYITLNPGESTTITVKSLPSGYTTADLEWTSSDPSKVSVDANGNVTAVAGGSAAITVKTKDGKNTAGCTVSVKTAVAVRNDIAADINTEAVAA